MANITKTQIKKRAQAIADKLQEVADLIQELKDYETKAQQVRAEQWEKAKAWGLLDACELLKYPQTEKAR